MACSWERVRFGRTGLEVVPLGLSASYGVSGRDVDRAVERGINLLYWGSLRKADFGDAVRRAARRERDRLVIVIQSYARLGGGLGASFEGALRRLGIDRAEVLLLGWWNHLPPERILAAAERLKQQGKAGHVMISCHNRPSFAGYAGAQRVGAIMVRYNAAHAGAEQDVYPRLGDPRPGVVAYTSTCWGRLPDRSYTPAGEATPRGSDCYRFALSHPSVDAVFCGPRDAAELDEAMAALDRGPMTADELAWMKRVGLAVRSTPAWRALLRRLKA